MEKIKILKVLFYISKIRKNDERQKAELSNCRNT